MSTNQDILNSTIFNHVVSNKYNCFYTNADSIFNKRHEIDLTLKKDKPDLVLITESCPKNRAVDFTFDLSFEHYSVPESDLTGRGVTLLVRDHIKYKRRGDLETFRPTVAIELLDGNSKLLLLLTYRSPNLDSEGNFSICSMIESVCRKLKNDDEVIILGDFNFPEINWSNNICRCHPNHPATLFLNTINDNFLQQKIAEPTHFRAQQTANILDIILTNTEGLISDIKYLPPWGKSHHVVLKL